jgi:transposase
LAETFPEHGAFEANESYFGGARKGKRSHHINGIENFWNKAKHSLRRYNGILRKNFYLFLKECEFRFNYGSPKQQFDPLRKWANL